MLCACRYAYDGEQTCAADGMCQEKCPVKINTGDLIKVRAIATLAAASAWAWAGIWAPSPQPCHAHPTAGVVG